MFESGETQRLAVTPRAYRWSYHWTVLAFTMWTQAIIMGVGSYSFNFWVVPWTQDLAVPTSQLMGLISASLIAFALVHPFCGFALDKFRLRTLYCVSLMIFVLALCLISVTSSYRVLLFCYALLLPIGENICGPLGTKVAISRWFTDNRGLAFGISGLGMSLGGVIFPFIVTALIAELGWRLSFRVLAVGTVVLLAPIAWFVLSHEPPLPAQPGGHDTSSKSWRTVDGLRLPYFWILTLCLIASMTAFLPLQHSIGAFVQDLGITPSSAALAASSAAGARAAGALIVGRLADWLSQKLLLRALLVLIGIAVAMAGTAQGFAQYVAGLMIVSFAAGAESSLMPMMVASRFGTKAFGQVYGLIAGPFAMVALLAPYFCGLIREATGSYSIAYLSLLLPMPFALAATFFLSDKRSDNTVRSMR